MTHLQPHHRQPDSTFLLAAAGSLVAAAEAAEVDFRRLDETFGRTSAEGAADSAFADIRGRLRQLLLQISDMKIAARKVPSFGLIFSLKLTRFSVPMALKDDFERTRSTRNNIGCTQLQPHGA